MQQIKHISLQEFEDSLQSLTSISIKEQFGFDIQTFVIPFPSFEKYGALLHLSNGEIFSISPLFDDEHLAKNAICYKYILIYINPALSEYICKVDSLQSDYSVIKSVDGLSINDSMYTFLIDSHYHPNQALNNFNLVSIYWILLYTCIVYTKNQKNLCIVSTPQYISELIWIFDQYNSNIYNSTSHNSNNELHANIDLFDLEQNTNYIRYAYCNTLQDYFQYKMHFPITFVSTQDTTLKANYIDSSVLYYYLNVEKPNSLHFYHSFKCQEPFLFRGNTISTTYLPSYPFDYTLYFTAIVDYRKSHTFNPMDSHLVSTCSPSCTVLPTETQYSYMNTISCASPQDQESSSMTTLSPSSDDLSIPQVLSEVNTTFIAPTPLSTASSVVSIRRPTYLNSQESSQSVSMPSSSHKIDSVTRSETVSPSTSCLSLPSTSQSGGLSKKPSISSVKTDTLEIMTDMKSTIPFPTTVPETLNTTWFYLYEFSMATDKHPFHPLQREHLPEGMSSLCKSWEFGSLSYISQEYPKLKLYRSQPFIETNIKCYSPCHISEEEYKLIYAFHMLINSLCMSSQDVIPFNNEKAAKSFAPYQASTKKQSSSTEDINFNNSRQNAFFMIAIHEGTIQYDVMKDILHYFYSPLQPYTVFEYILSTVTCSSNSTDVNMNINNNKKALECMHEYTTASCPSETVFMNKHSKQSSKKVNTSSSTSNINSTDVNSICPSTPSSSPADSSQPATPSEDKQELNIRLDPDIQLFNESLAHHDASLYQQLFKSIDTEALNSIVVNTIYNRCLYACLSVTDFSMFAIMAMKHSKTLTYESCVSPRYLLNTEDIPSYDIIYSNESISLQDLYLHQPLISSTLCGNDLCYFKKKEYISARDCIKENHANSINVIPSYATIFILSSHHLHFMKSLLSIEYFMFWYNSVMFIYHDISTSFHHYLPLVDTHLMLSQITSQSTSVYDKPQAISISDYFVPDSQSITHTILNAFINSDISDYNYELLEFIGDVFLKFYTTLYLYYDGCSTEGKLTKLKTNEICNRHLAVALSKKYSYIPLISVPIIQHYYPYAFYCPKNRSTGITMNQKADIYEALVGSVYILNDISITIDFCSFLSEAITHSTITEMIKNSYKCGFVSSPMLTDVCKYIKEAAEEDPKYIHICEDVQKIINYQYHYPFLIILAMTAQSYFIDKSNKPKWGDYQILECVGDTIVDLYVTKKLISLSYFNEYLTSSTGQVNDIYKDVRSLPGTLTFLRSSLVRTETMSYIIFTRQLHKYLLSSTEEISTLLSVPTLSTSIHEYLCFSCIPLRYYYDVVKYIDEHKSDYLTLDMQYLSLNNNHYEAMNQFNYPKKIYSDIFESLVASVYFDSGMENCCIFLDNLYGELIQSLSQDPLLDITQAYNDLFGKLQIRSKTISIKLESDPSIADKYTYSFVCTTEQKTFTLSSLTVSVSSETLSESKSKYEVYLQLLAIRNLYYTCYQKDILAMDPK